MRSVGFDQDTYIRLQSERINERRAQLGGKLYLEFGGKLFDDLHASRVLPGFAPDTKIQMLTTIKDEVEILVVVSALDIERNKMRADLGITYDQDVFRLIDEFRDAGLYVGGVVIAQISDFNDKLESFQRRLEVAGVRVYRHYPIKGYPHDVKLIVSEQGYGKNDYIETTRDVVVVTAPGPGSGKMATALSQVYHDSMRGVRSGYAKFETFPVWNLPLDHPVNVAYEAATADLDDVNMIDPFHLAAYGEQAVNYNRDVEVFPVVRTLLERITGESPYLSPTDMGVNMAGYAINDDQVCRAAAAQEVIRRYYKALVREKRDELDATDSDRIAVLMSKLGVEGTDRRVVTPALEVHAATSAPAAAIELADGQIVTGKTSPLLGACSAMLINALKTLAGIPDEIKLLAAESIEPIQRLKTESLGSRNPRLHTDEVLIALAVSATRDEHARCALDALPQLQGCDMHSSVILGPVDENILRQLGVEVTSEPVYQTKRAYRKR